MQNDDDVGSTSGSSDPEWTARHTKLDAALASAIRAPAVDGGFDQKVWARIRADVAAGSSAPLAQRRFGAPFWLSALNAIAIGVVAVMVAVALRAAARQAGQPALGMLTLVAQSPGAMGVAFAFASAAGLWLGLRRTPWGRAIGLSLAPERGRAAQVRRRHS